MRQITKLALTLTLSILLGCKDEQKIQKEEFTKTARIYFNEELKNMEDFKSLDSLRILKVDTLSDKDELNGYINQLYRYQNYLLSQAKTQRELAELKYETANLGSQMYGGYVNELEYKSAKAEETKFNVLKDSVNIVDKQIKHYERQLKKKDSLNLNAYEVQFIYQLTKKNMSSEKDTTYLRFSADMKVFENKNQFKNLQKKFPFVK